MDKTNDTESSSSFNSISTVLATDNADHDNDIDNSNDNDMLIFENGTLLGAISCNSSSLIVNNSNNSYTSNSNNNPSKNNLSKSQQNLTTNSTSTSKLSSSFLKPILITKSMERISSQYQNINKNNNNNKSTIVEGVLYNATIPANIKILPNNNTNNNNNNNNDSICNIISNDLNTSLLDHSYELDNNNLTVNNNSNNNNNASDNNSYIINNNNNNSNNNSNQIDLLNSSQCSFESHLNSMGRSTIRSIQRNKSLVETIETTVNNTTSTNLINSPQKVSYTKLKSDQMTPHTEYYDSRYHPPQYTAIYFDAIGNAITSTNGGTILNGNNNGGNLNSTGVNGSEIITNYYHHAMNRSFDHLNQIHHHHHHQYITAGSDLTNNIGIVNDMTIDSNQMYNGGINIDGNMDSNRNGGAVGDSIIPRRRGCFKQWFTRPSLPFVIGVLALGGVACTLGGIVLGSTGLVEHSTQYLSAALLMIGIGVSLLVISGAIWRLSIPDEVENCPCFRHLETCRNCNSPYCGNRLLTTHSGYMYPEFQHRPPPPSYLTSLNECTVGLLFHHEVANLQRTDSIRISTPPPAYRSSQSLSVFVPLHATVSPSQRSLIPELSMISTTPSTPLNTTTISLPDLDQMQTILSQSSELINTNESGSISQGLINVMSTVHDNSCLLNKKNSLLHLSDITIE